MINKITLDANYNAVTNNVTISDTLFNTGTINLNGKLSFRKFASYVGIGYGSKPFDKNNLSFDFGVMSSPVTASLSGTTDANNQAALNTVLVQRATTIKRCY